MSVVLINNAVSLLAASLSSGATSLSVTPGEGAKFPSPTGGDWFPLTLIKASGALEILRCTARSGDVLTVTRAQEGTAAQAFAAGDRAELRLTVAALNTIFGGPAAVPVFGAIELSSSSPYIDFHFGSSSADFTSRIMADGSAQTVIKSQAKTQLSINDSGVSSADAISAGGNLISRGAVVQSGDDTTTSAVQFRNDGAMRYTPGGAGNYGAWATIWNANNFNPAGKVTVDAITTAGFAGNDPNQPYFRRTSDNVVYTLQRSLGYTPVQQGTGGGQLSNTVKLGWTSYSRLNLQVDSTNVGDVTTDDRIMPILSLQAVGGIGTYGFFYCGVAVGPGGLVTGGNLIYGFAAGQGTTNPSGTWRCMGDTTAGGRTLFMRVS